MPSKSMFESRTIWFNILALLVALATTYGFSDHEVADWVPQAQQFIVIAVNFLLRFKTTQPIA